MSTGAISNTDAAIAQEMEARNTPSHGTVENVEALLGGQREERTRQQLDAGLHHAQFLEQARPVAVQALGRGLRPPIPVLALVILGMFDVHVTRLVQQVQWLRSSSTNSPLVSDE